MIIQANIYQFVDAGLAIPPRLEPQNGMGNGLTNGFSVSDDISDQQQLSKQSNTHELENGKENRTKFEEEKLERINPRLSESCIAPTKDPCSRFEPEHLAHEKAKGDDKQVGSPHSVTRRLRLEEAGSLLKPPPGSQSYSVQGLRKLILGSSSPELEKSSSSPPLEPSKSEKRRSILDHIRPTLSKSSAKCSSEGEDVVESRKAESKKEKELPLSCGQLALVGELPSALLSLPTTAELLGEKGEEIRGVAENLACSQEYSGNGRESENMADIKGHEPSLALGSNDPLPKPNDSAAGFTKDACSCEGQSRTDAGRPLPGKKVTLVRKKSLSENCLLPRARIQRRDGQVTTSQTLCGEEVVPVRNQIASRLDDSFLGDQIQVNGRHWEVNVP